MEHTNSVINHTLSCADFLVSEEMVHMWPKGPDSALDIAVRVTSSGVRKVAHNPVPQRIYHDFTSAPGNNAFPGAELLDFNVDNEMASVLIPMLSREELTNETNEPAYMSSVSFDYAVT
jgi:hypothetical protein